MNSLVLLIVCVAILGIGYVCYGGWLCKQWGVGESKTETPAHTMADGVDYVPAKAPVLMGHHFSSIAGAGPITGPIGAAMFGWLPVTLWILVGGIFFGGVHDFGALFASVRSKGQSIGEIISANMSKRAKQLFIIFSYLTLILVVAAFASIVASTFGAVYDENGALDMAKSATPATVAMISILFILIAIVFGFCVYRRNMPMGIASVCRRSCDRPDHGDRNELPSDLPVHKGMDVDRWSLHRHRFCNTGMDPSPAARLLKLLPALRDVGSRSIWCHRRSPDLRLAPSRL